VENPGAKRFSYYDNIDCDVLFFVEFRLHLLDRRINDRPSFSDACSTVFMFAISYIMGKSRQLLKGLLFFFLISFFISLTSVAISMTLGIKSRMHYVIDYLIPRFLEGMEFKTSYIIKMMHPDMNGSGHLELVPLYITIGLAGAYIIWQIRKYNSLDQKNSL